MKYLLIAVLVLTGCEDSEQQKKNAEAAAAQNKMQSVVDCHMGILIAVEHFLPHLKDKVTKEQFEAAWKECGEL